MNERSEADGAVQSATGQQARTGEDEAPGKKDTKGHEEKISRLLTEYESDQSTSDAEHRSRLLGTLDRLTWERIEALVVAAVGTKSDQPLDLPPETAHRINYALLGLEGSSWEGLADGEETPETEAMESGKVFLLTDWLLLCQKRFLEHDRLVEIQGQVEEIRAKQIRCSLEEGFLLEARRRFAGWYVPVNRESAYATRQGDVDDARIPYLNLNRLNHERGFDNKKQRLQFVEVKRRVLEGRNEIGDLLDGCRRAGKILEIESQRDASFLETAYLEDEIETLTGEEEALHQEIDERSDSDLPRFLREEVQKRRLFQRMCAQRAGCRPIALPIVRGPKVTPTRALEALDFIEEFDPKVFDNRLVTRHGKPPILIVPGCGRGVYDWSSHCLQIPSIATGSVIESVASAIVMYREDVDRQVDDLALFRSFGQDVKENRKIRSRRALRNRMTKSYFQWITREVQGSRVLSQEIRRWFERHIAPNREQVKVPPHLREMGRHALGRQIRSLQSIVDPLETNEQFDLAVCLALVDRHPEAIDAFKELLEREPDHLDGLYGLGLCIKRSGLSGHRDLFRKYAELAPESWWSTVAQEYARS